MIYVASSWRNPYYEKVVKRLKKEGLDVYDFRNPPHGGGGFHWTDVDENAPNWTFKEYEEGLHHPLAERQFEADLDALKSASACVLVLPCGRSAHTEAGWCAGMGKRGIVYMPEMVEPELMYKLFDEVVDNLDDLVQCFCCDGEIRMVTEEEDLLQDHTPQNDVKVMGVFGAIKRGATKAEALAKYQLSEEYYDANLRRVLDK